MDWIDLNDKKPEIGVPVLCARYEGGIKPGYILPAIGEMRKHGRFSCEMDWISVTHWMPLPKNPTYPQPRQTQ